MIKLTEHIRINPLTIIVFAVCYLTHTLGILCVTYSVMLLHETSHLLAAVAIGLKVSSITLQPFGVRLKLKNKLVCSLTDEIILYISGPLINAVLAAVSLFIYRKFPLETLHLFYVTNTVLFAANLLPAPPLDGGIIVKKLLSSLLGKKWGDRISKILSAVVSSVLLLLGAYVLYRTKTNFSMLLFSLLIAGNIFTQSEKYDADLVKKVMLTSKKKKNKIRHIIASENEDMTDMLNRLDKKSYSVIYITDSKGKIKNIITEKELITRLTEEKI